MKKEGNNTSLTNNNLTRKKAIKKVGKCAVLTAATMMMLLPTKAHADSSGELVVPTKRDSNWRNS